MQSSGKIALLNEDQRQSLIVLSNAQDFFERVSWDQKDQNKLQGLLHKHNELTQFHRLAYYMESHGTSIKKNINQCLELLKHIPE